MCVDIQLYICKGVCVYVWMQICTIFMYVCVCLQNIHTHTCVHARMYVYMYVFMSASMYICMYCTYYKDKNVGTLICMHMYVLMFVCIQLYPCMDVYTYICIHVCTYVCIHSYMYIYIYVIIVYLGVCMDVRLFKKC